MTNRIYLISSLFIVCAIICLYLLKMNDLIFSITIATVIYMINILGLSWTVKKLVKIQGAANAVMFLNLIRITIIIVLLSILIHAKIINIKGVFIGLTIVLASLFIDGVIESFFIKNS
ncbi:membrane protein [Candidatus Magnetoovum chiemensis]|nr:membrane protein [Candidatus Magnetoovum chiemensis]